MIKFKNITIYPLNDALCGTVRILTKRWGYVCFQMPWFYNGRYSPPHLYVSPNGTPWASTFLLGRVASSGYYGAMAMDAVGWRRKEWGHNYDMDIHNPLSDEVPPKAWQQKLEDIW